MGRILITGGAGLIGSGLASRRTQQHKVFLCDSSYGPEHDAYGDVLDTESVRGHVQQCTGIIHLVAVSRVVTAQKNPELCWRTNVGGIENVLAAAHLAPKKPWVILGSSREVCDRASELPVREDSPKNLVNVYARSKVAGEELFEASSEAVEPKFPSTRGCFSS